MGTECSLNNSNRLIGAPENVDRKVIETIKLKIVNLEIAPKSYICYLGGMLDSRLNSNQQVEHASAKASVFG